MTFSPTAAHTWFLTDLDPAPYRTRLVSSAADIMTKAVASTSLRAVSGAPLGTLGQGNSVPGGRDPGLAQVGQR